MPRNFRQSQFRGSAELGEDVNPSAYIVNLADCMLVLACGFLVALISAYNVNLGGAEEVDAEQMEEVDQEAVSADSIQNGSGYIPAGTVYVDPNTGITYWVKEVDVETTTSTESTSGTDSAQSDSASASAGTAGSASSSAGSSDSASSSASAQ